MTSTNNKSIIYEMKFDEIIKEGESSINWNMDLDRIINIKSEVKNSDFHQSLSNQTPTRKVNVLQGKISMK